MPLRMSHGARQRAWLCGSVANELKAEAGSVVQVLSTLLPHPCELSIPYVPFGASGFLSGRQAAPVRAARARARDLIHLRAWFRAGEEIEPKRLTEVFRRLGLHGRIVVTTRACGGKLRVFLSIQREHHASVKASLKTFLPGLELVERHDPLRRLGDLLRNGNRLEMYQYYPPTPYWRGYSTAGNQGGAPLVAGTAAALTQASQGMAFQQVVFERAPAEWASNVAAAQAGEERALRLGHAGDWGYDGIQANKALAPNSPLYSVVLRCGVCTPPADAEEALQVVSRSFDSIFHGSAPLSRLDTAQHLSAIGSFERIARMLGCGDVHMPGSLMTEEELAGVAGFVPTAGMLEDLRWGLDVTSSPPAPEDLQRGGALIAVQAYAGELLPVVIPDRVRSRHVSIEGKTGSGKSEAMLNVILGDAEGDMVKGGLVLDFHGVLCPRLLDLLGEGRIEKTVYFDPVHPGHVFRYNPFADETGDIAKRTDDTVSSIELLHRASEWGSNIAQDTGYYAHLLHAGRGLSLLDAPLIVSKSAAGERLRQEALARVENEEVVRFWEEEFPRLPPARMHKAISKVSQFLSQASARMFCQAADAMDWRKFMSEGRLVLANLAMGRMGSMAADAIGSFLLAQAFSAAMERPLGPIEQAPVWMVYLDEAQRLAPRVTEEAVTQLRKSKVYLVLAVQSRDQLPGKATVALRNVETLIALNVGYDDAQRLAREFGGGVNPEQLLRQRVGSGWGLIDGHVVPLQMLPPRRPRARSYAKEIVDYSLRRYYLTEEEFKEQMEERRDRLGHAAAPKARRGYDEI